VNAPELLLAKLVQLSRDGFLPRSSCSRRFLMQAAPLIESGVILEERSGGGRRFIVANRSALAEFLATQFPNLPLDPAAGARETAVAQFRDSKALPANTPEIVSVRVWSAGAIACAGAPGADDPGREAINATRRHGVFSFLMGRTCDLQFHGAWALVENPALFVQFERLGSSVEGVIYSRGKASTRLLEWLERQSAPDFSLEHFPDYDPAGLQDYQRVRSRLGERVRLHLPPDLERRFAKLSNPALLRKARTRSMLAALRGSTVPEILHVVALIDRYNAGLEQESLLIKLT
jgi:hypothetical protein